MWLFGKKKTTPCFHFFEDDFSEYIRDGWKHCDGCVQCKHCGEMFRYSFTFMRDKK
jgi:hypothetical protein